MVCAGSGVNQDILYRGEVAAARMRHAYVGVHRSHSDSRLYFAAANGKGTFLVGRLLASVPQLS